MTHRLAGDERSIVRDEERHRLRDVFGLPRPPERVVVLLRGLMSDKSVPMHNTGLYGRTFITEFLHVPCGSPSCAHLSSSTFHTSSGHERADSEQR